MFNLYWQSKAGDRGFIPSCDIEEVKMWVGSILRSGGEITGIIDVEKDK